MTEVREQRRAAKAVTHALRTRVRPYDRDAGTPHAIHARLSAMRARPNASRAPIAHRVCPRPGMVSLMLGKGKRHGMRPATWWAQSPIMPTFPAR